MAVKQDLGLGWLLMEKEMLIDLQILPRTVQDLACVVWGTFIALGVLVLLVAKFHMYLVQLILDRPPLKAH
jgi:hypothetical protein